MFCGNCKYIEETRLVKIRWKFHGFGQWHQFFFSPRKKIDFFFKRFYMRKTGNIQDMSAHFSQFWRVDWVLKANKRDTVYAHVIRRHWRWDVLKSRLSLWDSAFYKVEISNKKLIIHKVQLPHRLCFAQFLIFT